jgi:acetyl esterase/lipase
VQAACVAGGAPHDFSWFARPEIKSRFAGVAENLRRYLGGSVEEKPGLARLVSPSTYISPDCPPILILHGDADTVVPVEESVEFHRLLRAAGVDATLHVLPGAGHSWDESLTRDRVTAFFARTLAKK